MIVPSFAECQRIVREGRSIGCGSARKAIVHDDFPGIVVKVTYTRGSDPLSLCGQNLLEIKRYKELLDTDLPKGVRIPKTASVGGYIVQERVEGIQPWDHTFNEDFTAWVDCDCAESHGLDFCWMENLMEISTDGFCHNVRIAGGEVWLFDLAY